MATGHPPWGEFASTFEAMTAIAIKVGEIIIKNL